MTSELDPDFKRRWVHALRSGEYEQGRKFLNAHGKFCCLGVACEIEELPKQRVGDVVEYDYARSLPPRDFGLDDEDISDLMRMNDDGMSFDAIADHIEANIPAREA